MFRTLAIDFSNLSLNSWIVAHRKLCHHLILLSVYLEKHCEILIGLIYIVKHCSFKCCGAIIEITIINTVLEVVVEASLVVMYISRLILLVVFNCCIQQQYNEILKMAIALYIYNGASFNGLAK